MKKWILGIVLLAMVVGESSCVVREKGAPRHPHRHRAVVVY